jgi:hypothetical protein
MKNKGDSMNKLILIVLSTSIAMQAKAKDLTAEEGLLKVEKNISTSQSNIDSFQDNLTTIINNITLLSKKHIHMENKKRGIHTTYK